METVTKKLRETAKKLLADGTVDVVIGYRAGTIPLKNAPWFARSAEEADQLIWDSNGRINLANFLPRRTDKVAIVAKGCDARNVVGQIVEHQVKKDQVYIIGVPCQGMIDPDLIEAQTGGTITEAIEADGKITLKGEGLALTLDRAEVLRANCRTCAHRNPPVYDILVADPVAEQKMDRYADLTDLLAKPAADRWAYYSDLIKECIRCYACRDACPLCYCQVCFVDESMPQWCGKSQDRSDTMTYHLLRAFHCAGRCTDCGACESACPMGIKVRQFTRVLEQQVNQKYGYEAGLSLDQVPPLTVYRPDDPQEFIK